MTEESIVGIEQELQSIKQRNLKVEADKAWETSRVRIATIAVMTYAVAALLLYFVGVERFWFDAFVPVIGFYLSSRSLPAVKKWWIESVYQKSEH